MKYLKYFKEHIAWHPDGPEEVIHVDDVCKELNSVLNVLGINVEHSMVNKKLIGGCTEVCTIKYEFKSDDINIISILLRGYHLDIKKNDLILTYTPSINWTSNAASTIVTVSQKTIHVGPANFKDKINNDEYCYPMNSRVLYNIIYNNIIKFIKQIIRFRGTSDRISLFRYNIEEIKKAMLDYMKNPEIIPDLFISEIIRIIVQGNDYNLIKSIKTDQPKIWKQIENEETLKGLTMADMGFGD